MDIAGDASWAEAVGQQRQIDVAFAVHHHLGEVFGPHPQVVICAVRRAVDVHGHGEFGSGCGHQLAQAQRANRRNGVGLATAFGVNQAGEQKRVLQTSLRRRRHDLRRPILDRMDFTLPQRRVQTGQPAPAQAQRRPQHRSSQPKQVRLSHG